MAATKEAEIVTTRAERSRSRRDGRSLVLMVPMLFLAAFMVFPMAVLVAHGFFTQDALTGVPKIGFTLENFELILTDSLYYRSILNSVEITLIVSVICLLIGYPVAYFIAIQAPSRWQEVLLFLVILPQWTSLLIRSFSWIAILRPNGALDWALQGAGLTHASLDLLFTRTAVVIGLVHIYLPFMILGVHASLRSLDLNLIAASRDLGATFASSFRRVVLPLTLPGIATGLSLVALPVFGAFITPRILGGNSEVLIGSLIELQFRQLANWPLGAALGTIVCAVLLIGVLVLGRLGRPRTG
jgi:spermidine/putrescine transport system permease protein